MYCLACVLPAQAKHLYIEQEYQDKWCPANNGKMEVTFKNGGRCDCLTSEYAIEFDFAKKFHEAVGQALEYSVHSGKQPGIVLILESPGEQHYLDRLIPKTNKYNIRVWTMKPDDLTKR